METKNRWISIPVTEETKAKLRLFEKSPDESDNDIVERLCRISLGWEE